MQTITEEEYELDWELEWREYQASKESHYKDEILTMCMRILEEMYAASNDDERAYLIFEAHELCYELDIDSTWIPALTDLPPNEK
jgi:hypothetical protein